MYIGEIGGEFNSTTQIDYLSDRTFIEFDALIIDYKALLNRFDKDGERFYVKRKEALSEFLKHKEVPLTIITPPHQTLYFNAYPQGRSVRLSYFLPVPDFEVINETGQVIEVVPKTLFTEFLNKYKSHFQYSSVFTKWQGRIIAETPHTKKVLAFYNDDSVFLPQLKPTLKNLENNFLRDLIEILRTVKIENKPGPLPDWANNYFLPNEEVLTNEIVSISKKIEAQKEILSQKQATLKSYEYKKTLFAGTGNDLESEVENIFRELGFEIIEADRNRDDLIVKYADKIAVIEIKGVNNSAAEKHAAQLEKWVSNYFELNEIKPKGILLVNTYRESELINRTEQSFPAQMLKFSVQREHCLITSLQLLALYYKVQKYPSKKERLIDSLFETVGVYADFQDWNEYISYHQPEP